MINTNLASTVLAVAVLSSASHIYSQNVPAEIAALKAEIADLRRQIIRLHESDSALQDRVAAVESNHALELGPFVSVNRNPEVAVAGPNITFKGANIHIVSGSGSTNDNGNSIGLGNLIIGYDEDPNYVGSLLLPGDRGGSHNLVIGGYNKFTRAAFGGFVAGEVNTISNEGACVSGGINNTSSGFVSSVTAGFLNTASGFDASVSGGEHNTADGDDASVSGGGNNTASGIDASVSGGRFNTASGDDASISGGAANSGNSLDASISGGAYNTVRGADASISGGGSNTVSGDFSSITGGEYNTLSGQGTVVIGGHMITTDLNFTIAPKPPFP